MDTLGVNVTFDPLGRYLNMRSMRHQRRDNLRPLSAGETIDMALQAYRNLGWPMLKSTIIAAAIGMAGMLFLVSFAIPGLFTTTKQGDMQVELIEVAISLALAVCVAIPLVVLAISLSSTVVVQMTADYMVGAALNAEMAGERARRIWPRVLAVLFLQTVIGSLGLILSFGLLLISGNIANSTSDPNAATSGAIGFLAVCGFVVGGVWMIACFGRWAMALPAIVMEDLKPLAALKRAEELYKGRGSILSAGGSVFNLIALFLLVLLFFATGIGSLIGILSMNDFYKEMTANLPYREVWTRVFEMIPTYLTLWFLVPVWGIGCTIIYYERRVRLEGLDVEVLAQEVWKRTKGARFQL